MRTATLRLLILLVVLLPALYYAWLDRDMPDFGYLHDDGIFFVTAKSAASGHFRIDSLPEQPAQTKFPPLYPLLLSIVWKLRPQFPANLAMATALCTVVFAVFIWLSRVLYVREKLGDAKAWVLAGLLAVNPYSILFGTRMFSEIFFTCWVIAVFLALRRGGTRWIAIAGLLAGCAYLSRTAGLALLVSVPGIYLLRRQVRNAAVFAAAMLPAVIGWSLWTRTHAIAGSDPTLLYYTDYIRYQFLNVGWSNLAVVLWKNIDQVLYGMGSLILPKVFELLPVKILTQLIGVAMISGTIRLVRRGVLVQYAAFALISVGMLVVWHFPPTERFVLPLFPLLLAGLFEEMSHLAKMVRGAFGHRDAGQRVVAALFGAGVVALGLAVIATEGYVTFVFLHASAQEKAAKLYDLQAAYGWIETNLPASANVLSYDDPLLYLSTGHRGNYLPLMPKWWYAEDHASIVAAYRDVASYCRARGLGYILFTSQDLSREVGDEDRAAIEQSLRTNPLLKPVYQSGIVTIFSLAPASPTRE
jgi:hypothetical protein